MSENKSNESQLLRGAVRPTLIVGAVVIALFSVLRGLSGFYGALLAQFIVAIYFVVHILVSRLTRNLDPISTMAMALFSYFAKLFFLGLFLWALAKYTDRDVIDRLSFGVAACALTVAWLGGEVASYLKLKTHLPLPPPANRGS
jgi:fructose-specific phosphotransferase system IIC component